MALRKGKQPTPPADPPPTGEEVPPDPSEDRTEGAAPEVSEEQTAVESVEQPGAEGEEAVEQASAPFEGSTAEDETIEQAQEEVESVEEPAPEEISEADIEAALGMKLPKDPGEAMRKLSAALFETRKERDEEVDKWQRIAAEYDNSRKRSERESRELLVRERQQHIELASERMMEGLLPVLDALDSAIAHASEAINTPSEQNMYKGMEGIRYLLLEVMGREGLTLVEAAPGTPFDPAVHDAKAVEEAGEAAEGASEVVRMELRRGYRYRSGRVLRPAEVEVGFDSPAAPEGEGDTEPSAEDEEAAQPDTADVGDGPVAVDDSVSGEAEDGGGPEEGETPVDKD